MKKAASRSLFILVIIFNSALRLPLGDGGRHLEASIDYGAALILESPRLAHPPMDAILGIDFVLTNYFGSSGLDFREEGDYSNLLQAAQQRIWRPYALALAAEWSERSEDNDWAPKRIWPQLSLA